MKSISAIHLAITENTKNILVKRAPHISIRESHTVSLSAIVSKREKCLIDLLIRLVLKPFHVYRKSSPYAIVKKRMGDQRGTKVTS